MSNVFDGSIKHHDGDARRRMPLDGYVPVPPEVAERYRREGVWQGRTLGELFDEWVARSPNELALVGTTVDGVEERLTYEDVRRRADNLAAHLQARGIEPGSRVVVQLPNVPGFVTLLFALFKIGALPVLALPLHGEREIEYLIDHAGATAYAFPREFKKTDRVASAKTLRERHPTLEHLLVSGAADEASVVGLDALERTPASRGAADGPVASDVALFLLSGGTTGLPKLIPRTHDDYALNARASAQLCGLSARTVYLTVLPAAHNFPLGCPGILGTLCAGGRVVLCPDVAPDTAFRLIERERVTATALVPALAVRWMESPLLAARDVSSLELLEVGGQRFQPEHARRVRPALGCTLQQVFGMAEGLLNYTRLDDAEDAIVETQGRPLLSQDEIRIVDDRDQPVPEGEAGQLLTRGPYTIRGYYRAPEHNARAFTADGFYRTGDVVRWRGGNLVVEGRIKDLINRGGEKISAEEVENLMLAHPPVARAAVVAMPDRILGERICAFVVPRTGMSLALEDVTAFLLARGLTKFKLPERLEIVPELPVTNVGKVDKNALRERVRRALEIEPPSQANTMVQPGETKLRHLFKPNHIGRLPTPNSIKYGACCVSNYNTRDGFITPRELARVRVIAGTGCGLITNQGAYPDPLGEGKAYFRQIALFDDKFLPQFETIARYIHDAGAVAIQQILHAGRYGGIDLGYCVQPSEVPQTLPHFRPPREMTKDQIRDCVRQHADAARRAIRAGFDGTEVTSFMGYLLAAFNSKFTNRRTDDYGGSIQNRGRFMRELIDAIKQATPDHPMVIRLNGAELMDRWGGNTEDECFELMQQAVDAGVDMISVTVGWQEAPESSIGRDIPPGYWNYLAARAKALFPATPIAFGNRLPDPVMADACIAKGEFDYWEVCRPLLADPDLVHKAAEDRLHEVRRCVGSLNCLSRLFRDLPYTCTMNPALGHEVEPEYEIRPAAVKKKVMVIGAGPAGMECAITAAKRGHTVTVFERSGSIGGSLQAYAAHDLARPDDLASVIRHYDAMVQKLGIEVRLNTEANAKLMRSILHQYDVCVVASGARVDMEAYWHVEGAGRLVSAEEIATGRAKAGKQVVVIGAGKVGLALAESLRKGGAEVTLVESARRIAGDVMPSFKWRHNAWVEELEIKTLTSSSVTRITADGVTVLNGKGAEVVVPADTVIAASPRKSNQELFQEFEWMIDELHGCGDAIMPRGLDAAIAEGYRLGVRI